MLFAADKVEHSFGSDGGLRFPWPRAAASIAEQSNLNTLLLFYYSFTAQRELITIKHGVNGSHLSDHAGSYLFANSDAAKILHSSTF